MGTAALMLVACSGGDHGSPTAPPTPVVMKTIAQMSVATPCPALMTFAINTTLTSASQSYRTNEFSLRVGGQPVDVELPFGGAYRVTAWYGPNILQQTARWDSTVNIVDHQTTKLELSCQTPR